MKKSTCQVPSLRKLARARSNNEMKRTDDLENWTFIFQFPTRTPLLRQKFPRCSVCSLLFLADSAVQLYILQQNLALQELLEISACSYCQVRALWIFRFGEILSRSGSGERIETKVLSSHQRFIRMRAVVNAFMTDCDHEAATPLRDFPSHLKAKQALP